MEYQTTAGVVAQSCGKLFFASKNWWDRFGKLYRKPCKN